MQITTARPDDFDEIIPFLDTAFNFDPGFFGGHLAFQWNTDPEGVDWNGVFIIRGEDGRLASLVRVWEMQLVQNGHFLTCGGIGSVATAAHARGQGTMTALLQHAMDAMKERGYPLAMLWGDRFRYAPFGFESAGRVLNFHVNAKGLSRCQIEPLEPSAIDATTLEQIKIAHAHLPYHRRRNASEWPRLYNSPTRPVFAGGQDNDFGFFVQDNKNVVEWGGSIETVLRLAAYTAQQELAKQWSFAIPHGVWVPPALQQVMSSWSMNSQWCHAAILDLPKTLEAFQLEMLAPQLSPLTSNQQVWHLFGGPDAPRNLWLSSLDSI